MTQVLSAWKMILNHLDYKISCRYKIHTCHESTAVSCQVQNVTEAQHFIAVSSPFFNESGIKFLLNLKYDRKIIDEMDLVPKREPCVYIDGLVQKKRRNSIANALELRLSCTDSSIFPGIEWHKITVWKCTQEHLCEALPRRCWKTNYITWDLQVIALSPGKDVVTT